MDAKLRDAAGRLMIDFQQMASFVEEPLVLDRGEGCWLWDVDGRRYFDGLSGVMVANYGHGNKEIIAAVTEQIGRLAFARPRPWPRTRGPSSWWGCSATSSRRSRPSSCFPAARKWPKRPSSWPGNTTSRAARPTASRSSASIAATMGRRSGRSPPPATPRCAPRMSHWCRASSTSCHQMSFTPPMGRRPKRSAPSALRPWKT